MDSWGIELLTKVISQLDSIKSIGRCACVCTSWRAASKHARPLQLQLDLRVETGLSTVQAWVDMIMWLRRDRLQALRHVCIRGTDTAKLDVMLCLLWQSPLLSSVAIEFKSFDHARYGLLPDTITRLTSSKADLATMNQLFPRLQQLSLTVLLLKDFGVCRNLIILEVVFLWDDFVDVDLAGMLPRLERLVFPIIEISDHPGHAQIQAMLELPNVRHVTLKKNSTPASRASVGYFRAFFEHRQSVVVRVPKAIALEVSDYGPGLVLTSFS